MQAPTKKHTPIRTCIACGEKKPKSELVRLVRTNDNLVVIDIKGKQKGRGANICMDVAMFDFAITKGAIERALKLERKLKKAETAELRENFVQAIAEKEFRKGNRAVTIKIKKADLK